MDMYMFTYVSKPEYSDKETIEIRLFSDGHNNKASAF